MSRWGIFVLILFGFLVEFIYWLDRYLFDKEEKSEDILCEKD